MGKLISTIASIRARRKAVWILLFLSREAFSSQWICQHSNLILHSKFVELKRILKSHHGFFLAVSLFPNDKPKQTLCDGKCGNDIMFFSYYIYQPNNKLMKNMISGFWTTRYFFELRYFENTIVFFDSFVYGA